MSYATCSCEIDICGFRGLPIPVLSHINEGTVFLTNELSYIVTQQTSNLSNNDPTNQQNFDNPQTMGSTNNNNYTVYNARCSKGLNKNI